MARDHLIFSALQEARWIARSLSRRYRIDEDDLVSEGMIGLLMAERRFQEDRGLQFITFSKFYIRGAMMDYVRRQGPVPHDELAKQRRDPDRAAAAVKYHTRRVANYEGVVARQARDMGKLEDRLRQLDFDTVLRGLPSRLERVIRDHLAGIFATETGRQLGVTESRIVQLRREAEKQIRALMEEEGLSVNDLLA